MSDSSRPRQGSRRSLNLKVLALLVGTVCALGVAGYSNYQYRVRQRAAQLLLAAASAEEKGEINRAIEQLEHYLALRPNDKERVASHASLVSRAADTPDLQRQAYFVLERAILKNPDRQDLLRASADLARRKLGWFAAARDRLERLANLDAPDAETSRLRESGTLDRWIGECLEAETLDAEAAERYRASIARAPQQIDPYVRLANLLRKRLDEPAEADQIIDAMVSANQESARSLWMRGRYRAEFKLNGAEDDLAKARAMAPDDVEIQLANAANALVGNDQAQLEAARQALSRAVAIEPLNRQVYLRLAEIEMKLNRPGEAVSHLQKGVAAIEGHGDAWELLALQADCLTMVGRPDDAAAIVATLRSIPGPNRDAPALDYLEAGIAVSRGQWAKAAETLENLRMKLAPASEGQLGVKALSLRADLLLLQCQKALGNPAAQLETCERILAMAPDSPEALRIKADALRATGQTDRALATLRRLGDDSSLETALRGARLALAQAIARSPSQPSLTEVEEWLRRAEKADPNSLELAVFKADYLLAQRQPDRARAILEAARTRHPGRVEPWIGLAALATIPPSKEGASRSLDLLAQAETALGPRAEIEIARAGYFARLGGDQGHQGLATLAGAAARLSGPARQSLQSAIASAHLSLGDVEKAEELWRTMARENPRDTSLGLILFDFAAARGDQQAMAEQVDRLKAVEGRFGVYWKCAEATRLIQMLRDALQDGQSQTATPEKLRLWLSQAKELTADAGRAQPDWSRVSLLQAKLADLENNPDAAIDGYRRAIRQGDASQEVIGPLIQLLLRRGRLDEARELFRSVGRQDAASPLMDQIEIELLVRENDFKRAHDLINRLIDPGSEDYRDQLRRGSLLYRQGQTYWPEAEAAYRKAVALGRERPETWLSLATFLVETRQEAKATAMLQEAEKALPPPDRPLCLAQCHELLGDQERAAALYQQAFEARPKHPQTLLAYAAFLIRLDHAVEAQPLLETLIDPAFKAPADEVRQGRRLLAVVLADANDPSVRQTAQKLIESNLASGIPTEEDLQVRTMILSRTPSQRNEVIRRLEEAERKGTARPGELLLLARLHDDDGQWPAAKALLLRLAADHGEELQYLRAAAGALLLHGEPAPAKEFVERLSVKEPRALPTIELRARLLDATGHPQEAAGLLRTYLTQNPSRLKEIARLADQMSPGGSELAESLYKKFAAAHRDDDADALILAEYYVRTNQPEKAIEHCVADNPPASPERISQACIQALDLCRPAPSPAILNRVDGWLSRALAKSPGAYELQLHLALLRTLQGREEDAVAIYRKVLSSHPDDLFTLNNLSWMLALKFSRGEEALALIDRAIAGSSPSPSLLDTRAVALIALGRGGEAVQELKKALRLDADPATRQSLYFHMAQALLIENDQPAAQGAFRDALQAGLSAESLPALERPQFHQLHGELMSN